MTKSAKLALLRKHYPLLKHLAKCSGKDCEHIMRGVSDDVIKLMSEICINVMNKTLTHDPTDAVKKLTRYKKELRAVTRPKTSLKKKRVILQQKGGFIGALLGIALPILSSIIGSLTSRK
jgi:hypothetical protein